MIRSKIIFAFSLSSFLFASCATSTHSPKSEVAEVHPGDLHRELASVDRDQVMEDHLQKLFNSPNPTQEMIDNIDRHFNLLIQVNENIETFDKELDAKLLEKKLHPQKRVKEPLASKTYMTLLKMWQLRDRYKNDISYDYLRFLEIRYDPSVSAATREKAIAIHAAVIDHLRSTQDMKRVELQGLMQELNEIHHAFFAEMRATAAQQNKSLAEIDQQERDFSFGDAIFGSQAELEAYILQHGQTTATEKLNAQELARINILKKSIRTDLNHIAEPKIEVGREPQSTPPAAQGTKIFYPDTGDHGNIWGAYFPKGVWAFTFDDGPAARSTGDILDLLHNYKDSVNPVGNATFFWLAMNAPKYPQWIKEARQYGYPLENHSFTHPDLNRLNTAARHHEIFDANQVLTAEYRRADPNYVIQFFRCPYGSCYAPKIPEVRQMIKDLGEIHVYWRIDSLDWQLLNGPKVAALVEKQIQLLDHGVILMHDIHPTTVDAARLVFAWLKDQNDNHGAHYKMVTIPEVVQMVNEAAH